MTKNTIALTLLALALAACGGGEETPPPVPTGTPPATPTGTPTAPGAANPTSLTLGAPAVTVTTLAAPHFSFTLAAAGEYQIDAVGMPADVQLYVTPTGGGWDSWSDGDSGEGYDARLQEFLAAGTYDVRVHEYNHASATARVSLTALAPMTPVATIAPGAPATTVVAPEGDSRRAASVEVALNVATAGNHTITLTTTPVAGAVIQCSPEMIVIHDNAVDGSTITTPSGTTTATDTRALVAGAYVLRIRNWWNHACTMSLTVAAAP